MLMSNRAAISFSDRPRFSHASTSRGRGGRPETMRARPSAARRVRPLGAAVTALGSSAGSYLRPGDGALNTRRRTDVKPSGGRLGESPHEHETLGVQDDAADLHWYGSRRPGGLGRPRLLPPPSPTTVSPHRDGGIRGWCRVDPLVQVAHGQPPFHFANGKHSRSLAGLRLRPICRADVAAIAQPKTCRARPLES
jgi:hypothetical protein